ncbi:MAG: hypothetical protein FWD83_05085 [Promicromonosporaceae bacterium]|nr:hypothetical protein [Promicromonosporaceae bacterium]
MNLAERRARRARKRLPSLRLHIDRSIPGWMIRLGAALLPTGIMLIALWRTGLQYGEAQTAIDGVFGPQMVPSRSATAIYVVLSLALVLIMFTLRWPTIWPPLIAIITTVILTAFTPANAGWGTLALAAGAYLGLRLTVWATVVPWHSRVEVAALAAAAKVDAGVLGITLAIGVIGLALRGDFDLGLAAGIIGVLALAWWLRAPKFDHASEQLHRRRVEEKRQARANIQSFTRKP